jgi:hypothetical protein
MNDDFERHLRAALSRKEPPPGFAQRVAARVPVPRRFRLEFWAAIAVAALLLLGALGLHRASEQRRADEAKQQLMMALRITAEKLAVVEKILERSTN